MNLAYLWDMIRDRATADTGSGGLFNVASPLITAMYYARLPSTSAMPFVLYTVPSYTERDGFTKDVIEATVRFAAFVPFVGTSSITDPVLRGAQIMTRLRGDTSGGSAPTYGFHRWNPAATDNSWKFVHFQLTSEFEEHADDYYCWVQEYRTHVSK